MSQALFIPFLALTSIAAAAQAARSPQHVSAVPEVKAPPRVYAAEPEDTELVGPQASSTAFASPATREHQAAPRVTRSDHDRLYFDVAADGTVWVRGRTYKASFAQDAATYVPFLGSKAPRNFPLGMRVESVTIGGEPLAFDPSVPAVRHGDTIEYARGPFVERYLLTPGSVEQTFVFEALPRRGEIVVTLGVTSELEGATDVEGFRFENDLGHIRYGRAFAFHDDLDATPIASRLSDRTIELVAPASLVEGARGRFVIDPVLSTYSLETALIEEFAADTAYDLTNAVWLTVCEEIYSLSDRDIHAVRHTTAGTESAWGYVDFTGDTWRGPAIANNALDDQFLVVAAKDDVPNRQIWGRTVEATVSLNMSAQFLVSDDAFIGDCYAPDVGGDPSSSGLAYYCVIWEREYEAFVDYDIHARLVRTDATLVGGSTFWVDNSAGSIHKNPAISNSNGIAEDALQDWNVVWEDEVSSSNHNILGARVHRNGTLTADTFTVASSILDERNPSVTAIVDANGGTRPWMVAWQIDSGANGWDVRCRTFDGTGIISTFDLSEQFSSVALDQITPSCDTDGAQFVVAYDERATLFFYTDIKVSTLYSLGGSLGINEGNVSVSPGVHNDFRPRIVCNASSGSSLDDALIVFDRDNSGQNDVWATGYDLPDGGPVTVFCPGDGTGTLCPCSNVGNEGHGCGSSVNPAGAELTRTGAADISSDTFVLVSSGMPATASALFFQGTAQLNGGMGAVFGDGLRCAAGTVVRLGTKTASGGVASYPEVGDADISVRGAVPATGAVRYYQCWYRNAAAFCTAATFNLTNGLRVQWIP